MKVATIQTTLRQFFHHWITVTGPLHKLKAMERRVLGELLYYRYKIGQEVSNPKLVDKLLFSYEVKTNICDRLNITRQQYATTLTYLRKQNIVIKKTLNTAYAPELKEGDGSFTMAYKFRISNNGYKEKNSKKV